jgi:hypothetical protein
MSIFELRETVFGFLDAFINDDDVAIVNSKAPPEPIARQIRVQLLDLQSSTASPPKTSRTSRPTREASKVPNRVCV